ncbi:MAG: hypothetical protein KDB14_22105 [Planctomycetales bacterium]|nr:hypothetical protein [Planctomycetales bacterium]
MHALIPTRNRNTARRGFTVPEAMIGIVVLSVTAASLLLALDSGLAAGEASVHQAMADGLAASLLEEACAQRYHDVLQPWNQATLGPEAGESSRDLFDDIDDYHNCISSPPQDRWGVAVGLGDGQGNAREAIMRHFPTQLATWRTRVTVNYVNPANLTQTSATPTTVRRVTVFVERPQGAGWREIARATRMVGYAESVAN